MKKLSLSLWAKTCLAVAILSAMPVRSDASIATCSPPPAGLVSWWRGESNILDTVGGNHGILQGGVSFASAKVGQGFSFNDTNADVKIPASASLNVGLSSGLTIETWINPTNATARQPLAEWGNAGGGWGVHFWVSPEGTGQLYANIVDSGGGWHQVNSASGLITANVFQHVAVTYDQGSGVATLYLNGVIVAQQNLGSYTPLTTDDLYLGRRVSGAPGDIGNFAGVMDELSLYNRALATNEIQAIYTAGSAGKCAPTAPSACAPAPAGQTAWWPGENNGVDIIGGNTATLESSVAFAPGEVGQAFQLGSFGAYLSAPASASLNIGTNGGMTVECWINLTNVSGFHPILEWRNPNGDLGVHFWLGAQPGDSGLLFANVVDSSGNGHGIVSAQGAVVANVPQHVALTYDRTTGVGTLYVNGVVAGQQNLGSFVPQTSYKLWMGVRPFDFAGSSTYGSYLGGTLDELSLYSRALSANEIQSIYTAGSAGKCAPSAVPPVIMNPPTNQTVYVGQTAVFSVGVTGTQPVSYQWRSNNVGIAGATNATLVLNNVQLPQSGGWYSVVVTNEVGGTNSGDALLTVNLLTCTPAPAGLVSWWKGEGNGLDSVGGNNGMLSNGVAFAAGEVGQGFALNVPDAYVKIAASASLNIGLGGSLTIETWINPTIVTGYRPIVEWNDGGQDGVHFWLGTSPGDEGLLYANIRDTALTAHYFSSPQQIVTPNAWQHVALTYDQASGVATMYCNGAVVAQANLGSFTPLTSYDLWLGRRPTYGELFAGLMDETSLYNRALSANEIQAIFNAGSAGKCAPVPGVPVINSFSPSSGSPGSSITITGANFSSLPANNTVYFGAVKATVSAASPNSLTATVPVGATYSPITVTVNGLIASAPAPFLPTYSGLGNITTDLLAPRVDLVGGSGPARTAIGDLDGDGKADVVVANIYDGTVWIYRNLSTNGILAAASFAPPVVFTIGGGSDSVWGLALADLDGDGRLDIIIANRNLNNISIFQNLSSPGILTTNSFAARVDISVPGTPAAVVVGDLDGDGKPEIVTANQSGDTVSVLRNLMAGGLISTNSFAAPVDFVVGSVPSGLAIADIDGDGKQDLVVANNGAGTISVLRNLSTSGSIAMAAAVDFATSANPLGTLGVGDLDGDGKLDVVVGCWAGQAVSVFRNTSTPGSITASSLAARVDFAAGGNVHDVAIGDLDGDGKPDIAAVMELPSKLSIFKNTSTVGSIGGSSFAPPVDFSSAWNAVGVSIGDLDGDGRPDVIFGNAYDGVVSVYRNVTPVVIPCLAPPAGLVSWWKGENNGLDTVGGNHGVLQGGVNFASAKVGQGFSFNDTNADVKIPTSASLNVGLSSGLTIETWINPTNATARQPLAEWGNAGGGWGVHFWVSPEGTGQLYANIVDSGGGWHQVNSASGLITANVFQHVAVTYDQGSGVATLYLNGAIVAQQNLGSYTPLTTADLYLGRRVAGAPGDIGNFAGVMDELSLYNRALATNEIQAIYNAGSAGKCIPPLPPVIVNPPTNQTVLVGQTAVFSVGVTGTQPISYQWRSNNVNILGATNATLLLNNVQLNQNGALYSVVVTNEVGVTNSGGALLTVNLLTCTASPAGLVSWWRGQSNALDTVDGSHGTLRNGATFGVGKVDTSFQLDGVNDYVLVTAAPNLNVGLSNGFTIEAWINPTIVTRPMAIVEWERVLGSANAADVGVQFGINNNTPGCLNFNIKATNGVNHVLYSPAGMLTAGVWKHVAWTYDKASGVAAIHVNGTRVASTNIGSFTPDTRYTNLLMGARTLGRPPTVPADAFAGKMDELSIYGRALSTNELQAIFNAGSAGKCIPPPVPPLIVNPPTNQTVFVGQSAVFSVGVTGTQPISYQWRSNSVDVLGATNATLVLNNVQLNQNGGLYSVVVANQAGGTNSGEALLTVNPPICVAPPAGLVSWWRGESNVLDVVGGNHGSLLNGASFNVGEVGEAFQFATTNGGIKVPANASLDVGAGNGLTVEGWIKPSDLSRRGEIVEWNNGNTNLVVAWGVHLQILGPGELGLGAGNLFADVHGADGATHWIMAPGGTITTNTFQHVALTYDKVAGLAKLYCNGVVVKQASLGSFTPLTSYDFYIGRRAGGDSVHSFLGIIDEVSVYNRALATNEIQAIFNAGSAGKCLPRLWCVSDAFITPTNQPVQFSAAKLALNDVSLDAFPLTVTGAGPASAHGGTVTLVAGQLTYAPPINFAGPDAFTYTITDGHGGSAVGTVVVTVGGSTPVSLNLVSGPEIVAGNFVVRFAGIPGLTYTVEAATSLAGPWVKVANIVAPGTDQGFGVGVFQFSEPVGSYAARYYRTVYPAY